MRLNHKAGRRAEPTGFGTGWGVVLGTGVHIHAQHDGPRQRANHLWDAISAAFPVLESRMGESLQQDGQDDSPNESSV